MRTPPDDLTAADVLMELRAGWAIDADSATYLPLGFGSHHWRVGRDATNWFVTVDDLDARRFTARESRAATFHRLDAALRTARALRDAGRSYVVAPLAATTAEVLRRVRDRYALAVYPFIDGRSGRWGAYESPADRFAILDLLIDLHDAPAAVIEGTGRETFRIAERDVLEEALDDLARPWAGGPFAERTRDLLADNAEVVKGALVRHDELAAAARSGSFVLTHGEPHPGNTLRTPGGWLLIDWDTALLAPPERDLWILADGAPDVADRYVAATGRSIEPALLALYRRAWTLTDVATFTAALRRPHDATDDSEASWQNLGKAIAQIS